MKKCQNILIVAAMLFIVNAQGISAKNTDEMLKEIKAEQNKLTTKMEALDNKIKAGAKVEQDMIKELNKINQLQAEAEGKSDALSALKYNKEILAVAQRRDAMLADLVGIEKDKQLLLYEYIEYIENLLYVLLDKPKGLTRIKMEMK